MRFSILLHVALLAGAAKAIADADLPLNESDHPLKRFTVDLMPLIAQFDMPVDLRMEGPAAKATNQLSTKAVINANIPAKLALSTASTRFTIADPSIFQVPDDRSYQDVATVIKLPRLKPVRDQSARPISGEMGVTDLIKLDLATPTNAILQSVFQRASPKPFWHGRGRGSAPIPDLEFVLKGKTIAVLEVKTIHSMPNDLVDEIYGNIAEYVMTTLPDASMKMFPSLMRKGTRPQARDLMEKDVKIVEQVLGEMFAVNAIVGALTNLASWLILQRNASEVAVTKMAGKKRNGRASGLNIMLGMSIHALGDTWVTANRL